VAHLDDDDVVTVTVVEADATLIITEAIGNPIPQQSEDFVAVSTDNIPYIPVPGEPGVEGDPGPQGESAYESWLALGNVGTEQDFLDSLVGPMGPSGSAAASYTHDQAVVSDTWTVVHNLGFKPNVSVFDSAGSEVEGDIEHVDVNTVVLTFTAAFGGTAIFS